VRKEELIEKIKSEGNLRIFVHRGYICVVMRPYWIGCCPGFEDHPALIHLCGYVGVPEGHPFYGKKYDDDKLLGAPAHGGLTFSGPSIAGSHRSGLWWFGFDAAHFGDLHSLHPTANGGVYRSMEYMTRQTKKLAEWLRRREALK